MSRIFLWVEGGDWIFLTVPPFFFRFPVVAWSQAHDLPVVPHSMRGELGSKHSDVSQAYQTGTEVYQLSAGREKQYT